MSNGMPSLSIIDFPFHWLFSTCAREIQLFFVICWLFLFFIFLFCWEFAVIWNAEDYFVVGCLIGSLYLSRSRVTSGIHHFFRCCFEFPLNSYLFQIICKMLWVWMADVCFCSRIYCSIVLSAHVLEWVCVCSMRVYVVDIDLAWPIVISQETAK